MRRFVLVLMVLSLILAACGSNDDAAQSPAAAPAATTDAAAVTSQATATPDNSVATAAPDDLNTSFASAKLIDDGAVETTVKDSTLFYKLDVPLGGVVSATLAVDAGSPAPAFLTVYDKDQSRIDSATVAVGERESLLHVFSSDNGGTVFFAVQGNSSFTLRAAAQAQDDAGSGKDAPADDDFAQALPVKLDAYTGLLGAADKTDLYVVELPKSGARFDVAASVTSGEVDVQTFNADQNYMDNGVARPDESVALTRLLPADAGGKWFVRFSGEGAYAFTLSATPQNDADSQADAPGDNDFSKATLLKQESITGELGNDDNQDLFAIDLPKTGGLLSVQVATAEGNIDVQTFNTDQNYMDNDQAVTTAPISLTRMLAGDEGGRWYIRLGGEGRYTLDYTFRGQDDAGSQKDAPGDELSKALKADQASFSGMLGDDDSSDMFRIPASAGRTVKVTVLGDAGAVDVQLFNRDQNYGPSGTAYAGDVPLEVKLEDEGDYFIRLQSSDRVSYTVEVAP